MKRITLIFAGVVFLFGVMVQLSVAKDQDVVASKGIEGVWKGRVVDGATGHELTISDKTIKGMKDGKEDLGEGAYKLDTSVQPWALDVVAIKGSSRGSKYHGICKVEDGTLTWQTGGESTKRPKKFKSSDGFCLVLKKQ